MMEGCPLMFLRSWWTQSSGVAVGVKMSSAGAVTASAAGSLKKGFIGVDDEA